jgi:pimeloyl-ACP methyl ester carboxylesterase
MPVAIMAGRGDTVVEIVPQPERLHGMVPQSTLQILDGTGHMLHYEFPETVATTIEALAEQIRTPAGELATAE